MYDSLEINLEELTDAQIKARIEHFEKRLNVSQDGTSDVFTGDFTKDTQILLEFEALAESLIYLRKNARAMQVMAAMRHGLDKLAEAKNVHPGAPIPLPRRGAGRNAPPVVSESETILRRIVDWNNVALRLTPSTPTEFHEYDFYHEIIELCSGQSPDIESLAYRAKIGLASSYYTWEKAAEPDVLSPEMSAYLTELKETLATQINAAIDKWRRAKAFNAIIPTIQTLARYYVTAKKPNDAVKTFKQLIEEMEKAKALPQDIADVRLELANHFFNHNKFAVAQNYFTAAKETYVTLGEEYEMQAEQTESWIAECKRRAELQNA